MTGSLLAAPAWAPYQGVTALLETGARPFLRWRLRRGKEDAARLDERLGLSRTPRPAGPLVWLHGASVGEGLALLPLAERLGRHGPHILLTTGTVSSARVLASRLPPGTIHQFVPLDGPRAAARFLSRWRPDLVVFAESDLWPNLLGQAQRRGIPTALVNARMSARSFARWRRVPALARPLIGSFALVLAQTAQDAERFAMLGGRPVDAAGNLKFDAAPPPADEAAVAALRAAVAGRPVWVAASTHAGEDLACCAVHAALAARVPGLLTVVVPRRVDRAPTILAEAERLGITAGLRSRGAPITPTTGLHVADTMGEIGLFYRLETAVFVGKSLVRDGGGQNPIEPAKLSNAVLHGPHVANFTEIYATLDAAGGSRRVADPAALVEALSELLGNEPARTATASAARRAVAAAEGAADRTLAELLPLLPAHAAIA